MTDWSVDTRPPAGAPPSSIPPPASAPGDQWQQDTRPPTVDGGNIDVSYVTSVFGRDGDVVADYADYESHLIEIAPPITSARPASNVRLYLQELSFDVDTADGKATAAQTTANAALPKAGGTMTGDIVLWADADAPMEPVTKQQLDAAVGGGGATKAYVDAADALKEDKANKGIANGYASLDATAKVPAAQLPSYVDDVVEFANLAAFPATGTAGLIYVALDTGKIYRWSGSAYVEISPSPGSTDSVPEGSTNLYYTDERVDDRAAALIKNGTGITWAYNDVAGTLTPTVTAVVTPAALTKTDDTNVTLTLGGTPATALLQAASITAGWTGTLGPTRGGFGANINASSGVPLFASGVATFTGTTGTGNFVRAADAALTGNPTAPTPTAGDSDTSIATTAFVTTADALAMPKAGGQFTGPVTLANAVVDITPVSDQIVNLGSTSLRYNLVCGRQITFAPSNVLMRATAGTPEGVVTGIVGSLQLRSDGAVGTTIYTKTSGTGNTGWSALATLDATGKVPAAQLPAASPPAMPYTVDVEVEKSVPTLNLRNTSAGPNSQLSRFSNNVETSLVHTSVTGSTDAIVSILPTPGSTNNTASIKFFSSGFPNNSLRQVLYYNSSGGLAAAALVNVTGDGLDWTAAHNWLGRQSQAGTYDKTTTLRRTRLWEDDNGVLRWRYNADPSSHTDGDPLIGMAAADNLVINGGMEVWQRGASFVNPAAGTVTADRWKITLGAGSVATVGQGAVVLGAPTTGEVSGNRWLAYTIPRTTTGANPTLLVHNIENVRTAGGQTVAVSFDVFTTNATSTMFVGFAQNFGTGGSPSATVDTPGPTFSTAAATWERKTVTCSVPSISGKTLGSNNNDYLQFYFTIPAALGNQTFQFTNIDVRIGTTSPARYLRRPYQQELALCQRYYQTHNVLLNGYGAAADNIFVEPLLPVQMRAAPIVAVPSTSTVVNCSGHTAGVTGGNADSIYLQTTITALGRATVRIFYTADSEL